MVQLRTVEELTTCFPWAEPPDKASSSDSAPSGTDEPTPVPRVALQGDFTLGTAHPTELDATGESGSKLSRVPPARSGPARVLRTTIPTAEDSNAEEAWSSGRTRTRFAAPARPSLAPLTGRYRIVTEYEPHLRQATVERLSELFGRLRATLGKPETAARVFGLKRFMAIAYRESAGSPETRSFASAISLLQDFLRPHWSEISADKIDGVAGALNWLREIPAVSPRDLERLHEKLAQVLGGLSIEIPDDEDNPSELAG